MMAACDTVRPRQSNCGTEKRDDFLIRPLRIGNCEEEAVVVALVNRCYRSSENWTNESDILRGERITLFSLREESQQYDIFLIEHLPTSKIVACVKCGVTHKSVTGTLEKPAGYVGLFAVSPEFQSRGLGSWMLEFVEQHCRVQGMTVMTMDVLDVRDDIINWYERVGYKRTGVHIDATEFFLDKGEDLLVSSNFILLEKDLVP